MEEFKIAPSSDVATTMLQYFKEKTVGVPESYIQRFINNYLNRGVWLQSDRLYEWFTLIRPKYRYDDFIRKLKQIVKEADIKLKSENSSEGNIDPKSKKTLYLISQKGVKMFMMQVDSQTCEYYAVLEDCNFEYLDYQRSQQDQQRIQQEQQLQEELKAKDAQIQQLKYPNPESIYHIRNKRTGQLLYVGKDTSKAQNRASQHLTARYNIVMAGHQLIDLLLTTINVMDIGILPIPVGQGEATKREEDDILALKPMYNVQSTGNLYVCLCNPTKSYKTRKNFEKHMRSVHGDEIEELIIQQAAIQEQDESDDDVESEL